jgi:hypothetical protein
MQVLLAEMRLYPLQMHWARLLGLKLEVQAMLV